MAESDAESTSDEREQPIPPDSLHSSIGDEESLSDREMISPPAPSRGREEVKRGRPIGRGDSNQRYRRTAQ